MATTPIYTGGMPDNGTLARALAELQASPAGSLTAPQVFATQALVTPVLWANRPAASANSGLVIYVSDYGITGALLRSDGTYWKPLAPTTLARKTGLTTGLQQTGDQVTGQVGPIAAGVLYPGAVFSIHVAMGRDNNTDAYGSSQQFRAGTAGTIADTVFTGSNFSSVFPAGSGSLGVGIDNWSMMLSATSCARCGTPSASQSWQAGGSGAAVSTAVAIPDVTANALYFSLSTTMAAQTATKPQTGYMDLILYP